MDNLFDDPDGLFLVLSDPRGRHSVWPAALDLPAGLTTVHGPHPRQECLDIIDSALAGSRKGNAGSGQGLAEPSAGPVGTPGEPSLEALRAVFAELLQCDVIGPDDDFFALGGHSLLATRLTNRIKERFQVGVSLQTLFENPTPASLAEELAQGQPAAAARVRRPLGSAKP
ncbi:MbtH family protein [Streptomyces sp. rh34]|uniref:MbtH family protein n=1 Tax=Streptomyces sp. rh34 TaxID=2034272 RepID=UPI000BF07DBC|nr:MbtH family protein [Streptomyces sp. rh34]